MLRVTSARRAFSRRASLAYYLFSLRKEAGSFHAYGDIARRHA